MVFDGNKSVRWLSPYKGLWRDQFIAGAERPLRLCWRDERDLSQIKQVHEQYCIRHFDGAYAPLSVAGQPHVGAARGRTSVSDWRSSTPLASDQKPHQAENAGRQKSEVGQPTEWFATCQRREGNPSGAAPPLLRAPDLPGQKPVRSPSPDLSSVPRPAVTWSHPLLPAPGPSVLELHRSTTSAEDGDGQLTSAGSPTHASALLQMQQVVSVRSFWLHGPSRRARPPQEQIIGAALKMTVWRPPRRRCVKVAPSMGMRPISA
jgi:hypothetical protein